MAMGYFQKPLTDWLERDPLRDFFVFWDEIGEQEITKYEENLDKATREQDLQTFFEANPLLLIQHLNGGQGRWVIPRKSLGSEFETDFLIADRDSLGFHWCAIELESSSKKAFRQNGDPTQELTHSMQQIRNWRLWLQDNLDYARRDRSNNGLGLSEIDPNLPGMILIGRRNEESDKHRAKRKALSKESQILIHSYDWVYDRAYERYSILNNLGNDPVFRIARQR